MGHLRRFAGKVAEVVLWMSTTGRGVGVARYVLNKLIDLSFFFSPTSVCAACVFDSFLGFVCFFGCGMTL